MPRFASPSGKYDFEKGKISLTVVQNLDYLWTPPPPSQHTHTHTKHPPPQALPPTMPRCHQGGALLSVLSSLILFYNVGLILMCVWCNVVFRIYYLSVEEIWKYVDLEGGEEGGELWYCLVFWFLLFAVISVLSLHVVLLSSPCVG